MSLHDFMAHFTRDRNGVWHCVSGCTLDHPNGRIQVSPGSSFARGTIFMGVELAKWLDEQWAAEHKKQA